MDDDGLIQKIAVCTLRRRGITWTAGDAMDTQAQEAAAAAISLLRSHAGNDSLPLDKGEDLDLAVVCCWYLMDLRRNEFLAAYKDDLLHLRQREALYGDD